MSNLNRVTANILAIGTEVTSGQILNRNASWIAEQLTDYGLDVRQHMSVPDDRPLMLSALHHLTENVDHLFVTGGLGPTTDDFTREVVARFTKSELVFHSSELSEIEERLRRRGRTLKESQRQQCFFPKDSVILPNSLGTAGGFKLKYGNCRIWVLPGPPPELQTIWKEHMAAELQTLVAADKKVKLYRWNCLGQPEADLAEKVENALGVVSLNRGYRLNAPYVEVKIWVEPGEIEAFQKVRPEIEKTIGPWTVLEPGDHLPTLAEEPLNLNADVPLQIRPCTFSDLKEYSIHQYRLFKERGINGAIVHPFPLDKKWDVEEMMEKRARRWIATPFGPGWEITWGLFAGKVCVGHLNLVSNIESDAHHVTLGIGILSPFCSRGYGKKLMITAIEWAKKQKQIEWIDLGVFSQNQAAMVLYKKLGFEEFGVRSDAFRIDGHKIDDHLMRLNVSGR
jgi:nicotinamide-nucleotide amidase